MSDTKQVTWQDLAPPITESHPLLPKMGVRQHLTRILGQPLTKCNVLATYGNIVLVEWIVEPTPQATSFDPVLPLPLIPVDTTFATSFSALGQLQVQYVQAGQNPHQGWQNQVNTHTEHLVTWVNAQTTLTPDEQVYFEQYAWDIATNLRGWVKIPTPTTARVWYGTVFAITFLLTLLFGFGTQYLMGR